MAGPWFMVQRSGSDWQTLSEIWLSDGAHSEKGRVEIRVTLQVPGADSYPDYASPSIPRRIP